MSEISEKEVRAVADVLLGRVNAPEQEIYRAARDGLEAAARVRAEGNSVAGSEGTENSFILRAVGDIEDLADDLKGDRGVILEGSAEAIREAGKLWGERVRIIAASAHPAPHPSGPVATLERGDGKGGWIIPVDVLSEIQKDAGEWADETYLETVEAIALAVERRLSALTAGKPEQSGWQPIETAPRDGTDILGWHEIAGTSQTCFSEGEWMCPDWDEDRYIHCTWSPTHWMPLPTPPTAGGE